MTVPAVGVLPFVALLLAFVVAPLAAPRAWASNRVKLLVSGALGLPVLALYARRPEALLGAAAEYASFIVLLGGLYVVAGGILLRGDLEATPLTNTAFLGAGAVLASLIGTTGASMLLIRPLLQTNQERRHVTHTIVFFIFVVSNVGGLLTPLGDPPLFLGYLHGVPFTWTLRLAPAWGLMVGTLLAAYLAWDTSVHAREPLAALARDRRELERLRVTGGLNAVWLAGIVGCVAALHAPIREAAIIAFAGVSLWLTPRHVRAANDFSWHPIAEVAAVFLGIFVTMLPALELLRERGSELGVRQPWQFFWATGLLSSFLDNAPTYLAFLALGQGLGEPDEVAGVRHATLTAIAVGAVAMGANTYLGNAPNFMVKSIAERAGVPMPGFLGYMLYSGAVLLPLFALITFVFFRQQ